MILVNFRQGQETEVSIVNKSRRKPMYDGKPTLTDKLCEAVTGQLPARNIHEIQSCVMAYVQRIQGASEAQEWTSLYNLAEGLRELAERGLYHAAQAKAKDTGKFALGNHQEPDPR